MNLSARRKAFAALGKFLWQFAGTTPKKTDDIPHNDLFFDAMQHQLKRAEAYNPWFTQENLAYSCKSWAEALQEQHIDNWLRAYSLPDRSFEKTVAIVMAGNIPLVGFHDFLCVLAAGHKVLVKTASKDKELLPLLANYLEHCNPEFKEKIAFTDARPGHFDAIIATGSGNTARYFEHYFGRHPHIIRKNRNSVAILTGNESESQLQALGEDVFRYFGLGCRNVSKLFVPKNYDFNPLFNALFPWGKLVDRQKYMNNYDYNKAVYMMSLFPILENGFLMLREEKSYASPIATLFYEYYGDTAQLKNRLQQDTDQLQCVVAKDFSEDETAFGTTQQPQLWDYADHVDTMVFLSELE